MTATLRPWASQLLHFWFHELTPRDWYRGGERVDATIERRFCGNWRTLHRRSAYEFADGPQAMLSAVLLFDQVPRNIFRDDPRAFASDGLAQTLTHLAIARGWDRALRPVERQFLYMPLMHSEDIADQWLSVTKFTELGRAVSFARSHHRVISRFGRFPHRNAVLGRRSTPAEERAVAAGASW